MPKPATKRTQGEIMADMLDANIERAIDEAEGASNALGNLSGQAAADAQALLSRAVRELREAKALARLAFVSELP